MTMMAIRTNSSINVNPLFLISIPFNVKCFAACNDPDRYGQAIPGIRQKQRRRAAGDDRESEASGMLFSISFPPMVIGNIRVSLVNIIPGS